MLNALDAAAREVREEFVSLPGRDQYDAPPAVFDSQAVERQGRAGARVTGWTHRADLTQGHDPVEGTATNDERGSIDHVVGAEQRPDTHGKSDKAHRVQRQGRTTGAVRECCRGDDQNDESESGEQADIAVDLGPAGSLPRR